MFAGVVCQYGFLAKQWWWCDIWKWTKWFWLVRHCVLSLATARSLAIAGPLGQTALEARTWTRGRMYEGDCRANGIENRIGPNLHVHRLLARTDCIHAVPG